MSEQSLEGAPPTTPEFFLIDQFLSPFLFYSMADVIFDESLRSVVREDAERGAVEEMPAEGAGSGDRGANAPRSAPGAERVDVGGTESSAEGSE